MKNVKWKFEEFWAGKGLVTGAQYRAYRGTVLTAPEGEFSHPKIIQVKAVAKPKKK